MIARRRQIKTAICEFRFDRGDSDPACLTSTQCNAVTIALHRLPDESVGVGSSSDSDGIFRNRAHVLEQIRQR